jgi:hypothetical protein
MKFGLLDDIEPMRPRGDRTVADLLLVLVQAGGIEHDDIFDSLGRFGAEVIPKFG